MINLLDLAVKSYMVIKFNIYDYELYKPNVLKGFGILLGIYHKNEEVWNYLIVGFLTSSKYLFLCIFFQSNKYRLCYKYFIILGVCGYFCLLY